MIAARLVCERDHGGKAPAIVVDDVPKKPTYKQNWKAYNTAQSVEKDRFQELLFDLCRGVAEPDRTGMRGRKPFSMKDSLFAMTFKVYSTISGRRFSSDLRQAHARGHMDRLMAGGLKVCEFMENEAFTPLLKSLIVQSSLPLKSVDTKFAIDSSGFSTSRFERWFDQKYGVTRQKCHWVKVHICCGVNTHIVTAVRILDKDSADAPQFTPLVKETAQEFVIEEVSADKAYASVENFETVANCGGTGFIAFKSNHTGGSGGLFERMFHYFQFRREEFLKHYHQRSNIESTFSMIKRKFGDSLRSKTDTALVNETLCKILCHNLVVLIHEQHELGIEAEFWKNTPKAVAAV
ncbi:transposase [Limnoglobus roseus]|uniref:IS4/IS5 family transposase n=1 Tax=Limnoglobus roseus TaxID=2598579 RepID=A0A5C1AB43_9BACT|nr:transposase [Limnoglobus roseus]QEL15795.1 IS4/IS5 family transposase [Limnoglobus roseus]